MATAREDIVLTVDEDGLDLRAQAPHLVLECEDPNYSSGRWTLHLANTQVEGGYLRDVSPGPETVARRQASKARKVSKKASKKVSKTVSKKASKPRRRSK